MMLTDLESVFRSLKSELGLRPIYHQKGRRVVGHLFITVLAYSYVHMLRTTLKNNNISKSWNSLRDVLSLRLITASFATQDGLADFVRLIRSQNVREHFLFVSVSERTFHQVDFTRGNG